MSCPAVGMNDARWTIGFRARASEARRPISATLELTRRCNLRCGHCYLGDQAEQHRLRDRELGAAAAAPVATRFLTTDDPERFAQVGRCFLGMDINPGAVQLIDL